MEDKKNVLAQPDRYRWRDNPPKKITKESMAEAFKCAAEADKMECECWHTGCVYYGDCRKCLVFHMCLNQFPTCQRAQLEEWGVDYIGMT